MGHGQSNRNRRRGDNPRSRNGPSASLVQLQPSRPAQTPEQPGKNGATQPANSIAQAEANGRVSASSAASTPGMPGTMPDTARTEANGRASAQMPQPPAPTEGTPERAPTQRQGSRPYVPGQSVRPNDGRHARTEAASEARPEAARQTGAPPVRSYQPQPSQQGRNEGAFAVTPGADEDDDPSLGPIPTTYRARPAGAPRGSLDDREPLRPEVRGEVGPLIDSLRSVFQQDRAASSHGGVARCGLCYLHFALADLEYREQEGYYVCVGCRSALGHGHIPMVRRQQRNM